MLSLTQTRHLDVPNAKKKHNKKYANIDNLDAIGPLNALQSISDCSILPIVKTGGSVLIPHLCMLSETASD